MVSKLNYLKSGLGDDKFFEAEVCESSGKWVAPSIEVLKIGVLLPIVRLFP